jgi:hypothetical protein
LKSVLQVLKMSEPESSRQYLDPGGQAHGPETASGLSLSKLFNSYPGATLTLQLETVSGGEITLQQRGGGITWDVIGNDSAEALQAGDSIAIDGATLNGSVVKADTISPQARLAYRRKIVYHLTQSNVSPDVIERHVRDWPDIYVGTPDGGMDMHFYSDSSSTDLLSHAIFTATKDGELNPLAHTYLF